MSLEQELRRALRRKDPPSGFGDRVLSKIAAGEIRRVRGGTRRWGRVTLPIAASLMLAFGATYYVQEQQRRTAAAYTHREQAARDIVLALQIASEKISAAQTRVEEITHYESTNDY